VVFGHENNPLRDPSNEPEPGRARVAWNFHLATAKRT